jgi:hypothetical protein
MNIPPGFLQANLIFDGPAMPRGAQVVLGFASDAGGLPDSPFIRAQAIGQAFEDNLAVGTPVNTTLRSVRVKMGPNASGADATATVNKQGTLQGNPDSPQVAILVRKVGAFGGRPNRGRSYWPILNEGQTDSGGVIPPDRLATVQTQMDGFVDDLAAAGLDMVILHEAVELTPTPVLQYVVQPLVATQRRRLRKVGGGRRVIP